MSDHGTPPEALATGATDEQIEAAFQRIAGPDYDPDYDPDSDFYVRDELRRNARDLVPPGMVIAPASAVVGAAERETIGRSIEMHTAALDNFVWRSVDREINGKVERSGGDGLSQAELDRWAQQANDRWMQDHPHFDADLDVLTALLGRTGEGDISKPMRD